MNKHFGVTSGSNLRCRGWRQEGLLRLLENVLAVGEDPDNRDYAVSGQRLATAGWRPQIALADGLAELIKGLPALLARAPYGNV